MKKHLDYSQTMALLNYFSVAIKDKRIQVSVDVPHKEMTIELKTEADKGRTFKI